jgi:hypothetical protein
MPEINGQLNLLTHFNGSIFSKVMGLDEQKLRDVGSYIY